MSDETEDAVKLESAASAEQQAEAAKMGWVGPERYRGDPERFVDADEYIKRGETVLPIVKKQNADLRVKVDELTKLQEQTSAALTAAQKAIEDIELRHSVDTQRAVEQARKDTKAALVKASEAGDHEAVAELTDQLTQLKDAEAEAKEKPVEKKADLPKVEESADLKAWMRDNTWFGADKIKTSVAQGFAQEIAEEQRRTGTRMSEGDFYDEVGRRTESFYADKEEKTAAKEDKVGGANHRAGAQSAGRKGTYEGLPKDARDVCDAEAKRFVGPDKAHKDAASYRKAWAAEYYRQEGV